MTAGATKTTFAIGLDIGGTSMVAGVVANHTGHILSRASIPTDSRQGHTIGLKRIAGLIERVASEANVSLTDTAGIGVGCTGPVDSITGKIQNPYTLPGWEDMPLIEYLEDRFGLSACLLNDCHVAALGEYWVGAAKGSRDMIYITVGTGIGAGLILNGQLYRGNGLLSGEIGHLALDPVGPLCYCGAYGCLEMLAAGPAIVASAVQHAVDGSRLLEIAEHRREAITAQMVCQAASEGDETAESIVNHAASYLGIGITNLLNILTPEIVVLGGGVMQSWHLFRPTVEATIKARSGMLNSVKIQLLPASLGLSAGIIGAAYAILENVNIRL